MRQDHDAYAAQVAELLPLEAQRAASLPHQLEQAHARLKRIRDELCHFQHFAAANTMSDTNSPATRATWATVEQRVKALAELCNDGTSNYGNPQIKERNHHDSRL